MFYDIVTYCSAHYTPRLEKTINSWSSQSSVKNIYIYTDSIIYLDPKTYDSNKIIYRNIFEPSTDFGTNCARKALCIQNFLRSNFTNALFLDVDCLIIKDLSSLFEENFDVAVTIYPEVKPRYQTRNISSGFIAFKNCINTGSTIDLWVDIQNNIVQENVNSPCRDQKALSEVITEMKVNAKTNIKLLNGSIYNSHPLSGGIGFVKEWVKRIKINKPFILHFASGTIDDQGIIERAIKANE
jgi:hypothetical protein